MSNSLVVRLAAQSAITKGFDDEMGKVLSPKVNRFVKSPGMSLKFFYGFYDLKFANRIESSGYEANLQRTGKICPV
jgi:hypothetical protein